MAVYVNEVNLGYKRGILGTSEGGTRRKYSYWE